MKTAIFLMAISLCGCSTSPVVACPSINDEPVSLCRAESHCAPSKTQKFFAGFSNSQNNTAGQLLLKEQSCISNHLEAQRANATLKIIAPPAESSP